MRKEISFRLTKRIICGLKLLLLSVLFSEVSISYAQRTYFIITGVTIVNTVFKNKVYEGKSTDIKNLKNTIRGNSIFKDSSTNTKDIVFTVLDGKANKSGIIKPDSLLFYVKNNILFFRTKDGKFRNAGVYNPKEYGTGMLVFFQEMETIAFFMAVNLFK